MNYPYYNDVCIIQFMNYPYDDVCIMQFMNYSYGDICIMQYKQLLETK